jgi:hypothetical protein
MMRGSSIMKGAPELPTSVTNDLRPSPADDEAVTGLLTRT